MSMGLAALIAWLITASIGGYMLRTWVARGGLRRQRATGEGVPPGVVFGHASAALVGLTVWISYLISSWRPLAWIGVALVSTAISLGICTVTLWTPYPVRPDPGPGGQREAGDGEARPPGGRAGRHAAAGRRAAAGPHDAAGPQDAFAVTDEMIASLLAEPVPVRRRRLHLLPLIPAAHGIGALSTFLLTVTAALLPVR
jgi:manganese efflux pump family protein